jgi:hypothetical protein
MNRLIISRELSEQARSHLFRQGGERFLFFLCSISNASDGLAFRAREVLPVDDEDLSLVRLSLEIKLQKLIEIMNRANTSGMALVEAHSHPRGFDSFSLTDLNGFGEFVPYVLDALKRPYGATVWDGRKVLGACWREAGRMENMVVDMSGEIVVGKRRKSK